MRKAKSSGGMYEMLGESFSEDDAMAVELEIDDLTSELVQKIDKAFTELRSRVVANGSVSSVRFDRVLTQELCKQVVDGLYEARAERAKRGEMMPRA